MTGLPFVLVVRFTVGRNVMRVQVWLVLIDREMRKRVVALTALLFQLLSFAAFASAQAESAQTNAASTPAHIQLLQRVPPTYPPVARQARIQGPVVLDVVIGTDGSVSSATVVSGHPLLVQSALDAVKQWKYEPYVLDGRAVEVRTQITVQFALQTNGEPNTAERAAQSEGNYVDMSEVTQRSKTGCPISHNPAMQGDAICTSKQEAIAYCAQQMNKPDFLDHPAHGYFVRWTNNPYDHNDAWCDYLLSKDADVPPDIRAKMNEILKPVIERAKMLERTNAELWKRLNLQIGESQRQVLSSLAQNGFSSKCFEGQWMGSDFAVRCVAEDSKGHGFMCHFIMTRRYRDPNTGEEFTRRIDKLIDADLAPGIGHLPN
jgi:TonB family protein